MFARSRTIRPVCRLTSLLLVMALLVGCGSQGSPANPVGQRPSAGAPAPAPRTPELILATTTSTQDSGLLDALIPLFEKKTGYLVKPIAVGTGQALAMGDQGEADVLLVHAPDAEKQLVAKGTAVDRKLIMHNDFILVGSREDPAQVTGSGTAADALKRIAAAQSVFISRGDDSGTNKKELALWKAAGVTPEGSWYQETGSGMGQTLNIANEKDGYTLTDRATYLAHKQNLGLQIVLEGDAPLLNIYHVMLVNPERFGKVNTEGARAFSDFLLSAEGQESIATFGIDTYGQPLFFPDGGKTEEQLTGGK